MRFMSQTPLDTHQLEVKVIEENLPHLVLHKKIPKSYDKKDLVREQDQSLGRCLFFRLLEMLFLPRGVLSVEPDEMHLLFLQDFKGLSRANTSLQPAFCYKPDAKAALCVTVTLASWRYRQLLIIWRMNP